MHIIITIDLYLYTLHTWTIRVIFIDDLKTCDLKLLSKPLAKERQSATVRIRAKTKSNYGERRGG